MPTVAAEAPPLPNEDSAAKELLRCLWMLMRLMELKRPLLRKELLDESRDPERLVSFAMAFLESSCSCAVCLRFTVDPVDCRHATCETSAVLLAMLSKLPRLVVGATDGSESLRLLKAGGIVELEDEYELAMFIDAALATTLDRTVL